MLGIGERTLYRNMQEWKVQDKIKQALAEANGNIEAAAESLEHGREGFAAEIEAMGDAARLG